MMNEKIELWFPTPIYYVDNLLGNDYSKYSELFLNEKYDTHRDDFMNVDSSYQLDISKSIHHIEKFKYVFDTIEKHTYNFAKHYGYKRKLKLDTSWINNSKEGDYLHPHVHGNSLISGAYYIKGSKKDEIRFFKNITDMKSLPDEDNDLNHRSAKYSCLSDRLVLFFSDTLHMTPRQKGNEKITLSFNYKY